MTLAISVLSRFDVFQVTDRLLTTQSKSRVGGGPEYREWDAYSNKNVIYEATDALVSVSYAGSAFMAGVPTDEWIAGALLGQDLRPAPRQREGFYMGVRKLSRFGVALRNLKLELERATWAPQSGLDIYVAGFRWRRRDRRGPNKKLPFPFFVRIVGPLRDGSFRQIVAPRYWGWHDATGTFSIGSGAKQASPLINQALSTLTDADEAADTLAGVVQRVADVNSSVGADCMSIRLSIQQPVVRVRYIPKHLGAGSGAPPYAYAPWILMRNIAIPPALLGGSVTVHSGWAEIELSAPEQDGDFVVFFEEQERRIPPGSSRGRRRAVGHCPTDL